MVGAFLRRRASRLRPAATFVGAASGTTTVNYPAGTATGDAMFLFVTHSTTVATPSGWSLATSYAWTNHAGQMTYLFVKVSAGETSVTFTSNAVGALAVYRGTRGIGNAGSWQETATGASSVATGNVTLGQGNSYFLAYAVDKQTTAPSSPAGVTSITTHTSLFASHNMGHALTVSPGVVSASFTQATGSSAVALGIEILST